MQSDFGSYLLYLLILIVVFFIIVFIVKNRLKKKKTPPVKLEKMYHGTIGVFFDREGSVVIIPYVKDKYGKGKATGDLVYLSIPYNEAKLGQSIRQGMKLSEKGTPGKDEEFMPKLGTRSWKEFSEGKRNISVHYKEGNGVVLNTTRRIIDGSYQFNHFGFEKVISELSTDEEIGKVLLHLLERCR